MNLVLRFLSHMRRKRSSARPCLIGSLSMSVTEITQSKRSLKPENFPSVSIGLSFTCMKAHGAETRVRSCYITLSEVVELAESRRW